jgi:hypothetical protein
VATDEISDQLLHVGLHQGNKAGVDDRDPAEGEHQGTNCADPSGNMGNEKRMKP